MSIATGTMVLLTNGATTVLRDIFVFFFTTVRRVTFSAVSGLAVATKSDTITEMPSPTFAPVLTISNGPGIGAIER
jgi:hypothetical protein